MPNVSPDIPVARSGAEGSDLPQDPPRAKSAKLRRHGRAEKRRTSLKEVFDVCFSVIRATLCQFHTRLRIGVDDPRGDDGKTTLSLKRFSHWGVLAERPTAAKRTRSTYLVDAAPLFCKGSQTIFRNSQKSEESYLLFSRH